MNDSQQPLISIIIPFFNEEKYLSRCLKSVKMQTYNKIEIILIDDGSTDNSLQIVEEFRNYFSNFKLKSIQNSGQAIAKNVGLKEATGEYITFLDADDALESEMMMLFVNAIITEESDIIICDISAFSQDGKTQFQTKWNNGLGTIKDKESIIDKFYKHEISETVWAKMFKSKTAKKILFKKDLWFDDRPFLLEYLLNTNSATFLDQKLLKIYRRNSSITRRVLEPKRIIDVYRVLKFELDIVSKFDVILKYKERIAKDRLNVFMDTFLIQIIDREKIINLKDVRSVFIEYVLKFEEAIDSEKINLKFKDKIALKLIQLPLLVGWNFSNLLLTILKRKRIKCISALKNNF